MRICNLNIFLLAAVTCLLSAEEEPLPVQYGLKRHAYLYWDLFQIKNHKVQDPDIYITGYWNAHNPRRHFPSINENILEISDRGKANERNLIEEMTEEYMNLTRSLGIPSENIRNIYERDTCPKWKSLSIDY